MQEINGYRITKELSTEDAGFCKWGFVKKNGHEYFIKEFLAPKYPLDSHDISEETKKKKRDECEKFHEEKIKLYNSLKECRSGNVVWIYDFFREGSKYYAVTDKVERESISCVDISEFTYDQKLVLTKSLLYSFSLIHAKKIVHADIKPENILIKKTEANYYTAKIIDFDASFFEDSIPEEVNFDQVYLAPETRMRMIDNETKITTKADIFALGLLLHQYWSGKMPYIDDEYDYVFAAVLDDSEVTLDSEIPDNISSMIKRMLEKEADARPSAKELLSNLNSCEKTPEKVGGKVLRPPAPDSL